MKKTYAKTKKKIFEGVATALITPFKNDRIDYTAFENLIERQIELGVNALLFCGTTGEAPTLSEKEKANIFTFAKKTAGDRVPLIFGSGTNSHAATMRLCARAIECGADALLCVTPYYNKGTPRGIVTAFSEVCSLGAPVILYNIPSRTGVDVDMDMLKQLSEEENLCAIKECAGVSRISSICAEFPDKYAVYSGNDGEFLPSLSVGAVGVVSVMSNLYPELISGIYKDFCANDNQNARKKHLMMQRLNPLLFSVTNPAPIKYAMSIRGLCENTLRLPLMPVEGEICKKIENEMKKIEQNI